MAPCLVPSAARRGRGYCVAAAVALASRARPAPQHVARAFQARRQFSTPSTPWALLPSSDLGREAVLDVRHDDTVTLSRRELRDHALSFAGKLSRDLGYNRGDKLALVLGENCLESIVAQLGAALAGVTVVTAKSPADAALAECRGIVVSTTISQDSPPQGLMPHEKHPPIVCHDDFGVGSASVALFWQAIVDTRPIDLKSICTHAAHPFAIYGSASAMTQQQAVDLAASMHKELALSSEDRVVLPVPLAHSFGFASGALATLMAGGTVILPRSKDHTAIVEAMDENEASVMLCDTHIIKALTDNNLSTSTPLRAGVVKVGSGNSFNMGPSMQWSGTTFVTIGKPA